MKTGRGLFLAVVVTLGVCACSSGGSSGGSSADHGRIETAYVAQLYKDGYTDIKSGVDQGNVFGCPDYAIGNGGDGNGELVVQCPSTGAAYMAALNIGGSTKGDLVIKTGPLNTL